MARSACEAYGYKLSDKIEEYFTYRTTHNDGVFRVYTDEMRLARKCHVITGLPDAYGRGRIIGDYRRVALYGVNRLIEEKKKDLHTVEAAIALVKQEKGEAAWKGKYIKIKYVTQLPTRSPSFAFFCNLPQYIREPYRRFLENKLRSKFDFLGCPVQVFLRQK